MGVAVGVGMMSGNLFREVLIILVGVGIAILINWALRKYMREMGKERIKYWRGAQTEAFVAWMLQGELENDWHVFNGIMLQEGWDIDHIVVGPGGVFSISTKNCRGCFVLGIDGKIILNSRLCEHVPAALGQAMELAERMRALMGADVPWVQAILAAPFGYVDYPERKHKVWVLHQENLTDALAAEGKKKVLTTAQVERCVQVVGMLGDNSRKVWKPEKELPIAVRNATAK